MDNLAFTWLTKSMNETDLEIQIEFEKPLFISFGGFDSMQLEVLNSTLFRSVEDFQYLPRGYTLERKIKSQLVNSDRM